MIPPYDPNDPWQRAGKAFGEWLAAITIGALAGVVVLATAWLVGWL